MIEESVGYIMKIHIVGSVKGGSGKSTFSAKLCCSLALQGKRPCIIDLDLLGTSWKHIYENSIVEYKFKLNRDLIYLNDLIKDFDYFKDMFYIQKINIELSSGLAVKYPDTYKDGEFYMHSIFCDPSPTAKKAYQFSDKAYTPTISYDVFHDGILELLKLLERKKYTDVILDMPPNTDPYSEKVLNTCLREKWDLPFEQSTNLYMVSNINPAHIKSTLEWYHNFINKNDVTNIVTINSFKRITDATEGAPYEIGTKETFDKGKKDWYENERFKFFVVFNETMLLNGYSLKNLIENNHSVLAEQLMFYHVKFDNVFANSILGLLGFPGTAIAAKKVAMDALDLTSFKLYEEIRAM